MVALKGDKEIGDKINKIIGKLAEANDLKGVIDVADFNDEDKLGKGKEMVDRLSKLVAIFETRPRFPRQPRRGRRPAGRRLRIPDAPLRHRVGQEQGPVLHPGRGLPHHGQGRRHRHGTPARTRPSTTPPAAPARCCSRRPTKRRSGITIYGQEKDNATWALAKMNMILHDCPTAEIWQGNTLTSPQFKNADGSLKTFDFVVANPPFSTKAWSNGFDPANDDLRPLRVRHPAREERRLCLPAAHPQVAQEHRQGRGHSAARRALPRQRRGGDPQEHRPAGLHQGHHRPAGQPLLRHRHPGLHHRARQGERRRPARASS